MSKSLQDLSRVSCFFFFKQKTAYEMSVSDWSSDVCSSDLGLNRYYNPADGLFDLDAGVTNPRSEEHTSELQSLTDISYAVFCLKKKSEQRLDGGRARLDLTAGAAWTPAVFFFFNDPAPPEIYTSVNTLSLHDALPISADLAEIAGTIPYEILCGIGPRVPRLYRSEEHTSELQSLTDISYAVFCLK